MNTHFISEFESLFKRFPESQQLFKQVMHELQNMQRPANELLLDDWDLMQILKVCKRSIANYKEQGKITYSKFGGKSFYLYSDVLEAVMLNQVPAIYRQNLFGPQHVRKRLSGNPPTGSRTGATHRGRVSTATRSSSLRITGSCTAVSNTVPITVMTSEKRKIGSGLKMKRASVTRTASWKNFTSG